MARRKNHNSRMTLVAAFLMISGIGMPLTASAGGYGNYPLEFNPDWVISNDTSVWDESYTVYGNIIVMDGGNLTFENVSIYFAGTYDGECRFEVQDGGQLHIKDKDGVPSVIASSNQYSYRFLISGGASAEISNSLITDCGYDDWNGASNNNTGLWITSSNVTISNCNISGNYVGIYLYDTSNVSITNCYISSNTYGIYIQKSYDLVIAGNIIDDCDEDGIYLSPTYSCCQTMEHLNLILSSDFNGGYIGDWNVSTSGSSTISTSTQQYHSEDKSLFFDSTDNGRAYATTPELTYDSNRPYNLTTNIYLPDSNNHMFDVLANGQIKLYLDGTFLNAWYDDSGHSICSLGTACWYKIRCDVTPSGATGTYDIYIDDVYCETADFDEDEWTVIGMGEQSDDDSTYGCIYVDDLCLTNYSTSFIYNKNNISIENNQISNCEIGINCIQGTCVNISQNQISYCEKGIDSSASNIRTNNNYIVDCDEGIQITNGHYYEGEIIGEQQFTIETSNTTTFNLPGGAFVVDASFNLSGSSLTNLKMDIGCDDAIEWQSDGGFDDLITTLGSSTLVDPMNDYLNMQYVGETNTILIQFSSETSGELTVSNISIKYLVFSIHGDSITNTSCDGITVENSQLTVSDTNFNNIGSYKLVLDNSGVQSVGCNMENNDVDVDSTSMIFMTNYLTIELMDRNGAYISNGHILVKELSGTIIFNKDSATGSIVLQAKYCIKTDIETIPFTPHNITVQKSNITQYNDITINQSQTASFVFSRLDIRAINVSISNEYPILNDEIFINATIYNDGYEPASNDFTVRFYLNNTTEDIFIGEQTINGLNAWSETILETISTIVDETGYFSIIAKIDDDDNITEDMESNNISRKNMLVCDEYNGEWVITATTLYNDKVVVADSLTISSDLHYENGILEIIDGGIIVSSNGYLCINQTIIVANDIYLEDGEINTDNVSIGINNQWNGQHNIIIDDTSVANINNTLFYSEEEGTYFNITINGNARISNTTIANMDDGLIIESPNVSIDNIGIYQSNIYGLNIISTNISIINSRIVDTNNNEICINNSNVTMVDCEFNESRIESINGNLEVIGSIRIRVIDENSENLSNVNVIIKDLNQSCIFLGETDITGVIYLSNGTIFKINTINEQISTIYYSPYTIIIEKDGKSNVSKLFNIGPNKDCEEYTLTLKAEYNDTWITEINISIPMGHENAFSSEPFGDGMFFCAHIYQVNASNTILELISYNDELNVDINDLFYEARIYNETGIELPVCIAYGYGFLYINSTVSIDPGHYDVIWKYWNDADSSTMSISTTDNKLCFLSCDAMDVNTYEINYIKTGIYDINISFDWDAQSDIYLRGYIMSINHSMEENSFIAKILDLNNSEIIVKNIYEDPLYMNGQFGYFLGNNPIIKSINFQLNISSIDLCSIYSPTTYLFKVSNTGWKDPQFNDLNNNMVCDYLDNIKLNSYIINENNAPITKYECWHLDQLINGRYISSQDCLIRRGYSYKLYYYNPNDKRPAVLQFQGYRNNEPWVGIDYSNINEIYSTITLSQLCPAGIVHINIGHYFSMGFGNIKKYFLKEYTLDVYIIFDLPQTSGNKVEDGLTQAALAHYLYRQDTDTSIDPDMDKTSIYSFIGVPNQGVVRLYTYGKGWSAQTGGLNQFSKKIYQLACAAAYGFINEGSAAYRIMYFVDRMIHGTWASFVNLPSSERSKSVDTTLSECTIYGAMHPENIIQNSMIVGLRPLGGNRRFQCDDFSGISTALYRAVGLPARQVVGSGYSGSDHPWGYHIWTEVWTDHCPIPQYSPEWLIYDSCGCKFTFFYSTNPNIPAYGTWVDSDEIGNYYHGGLTRNNYYSSVTSNGQPAQIYLVYNANGNVQEINIHNYYTT